MRERFHAQGVRYTRNLNTKRNFHNSGWRSLGDTKEAAQETLKAASASWEWLNDDVLEFQYTTPALLRWPAAASNGTVSDSSAMECLFCNAQIWGSTLFTDEIMPFEGMGADSGDRPVGCSWGDGTEFTREEVEELREIYSLHAVGVAWQRGDVLLCDNLRTSHGRCDLHDKTNDKTIHVGFEVLRFGAKSGPGGRSLGSEAWLRCSAGGWCGAAPTVAAQSSCDTGVLVYKWRAAASESREYTRIFRD